MKLDLRIVVAEVPPGWEGKYPWKNGEHLLMLGGISNMPGHVAVANRAGKVLYGYDEDNFREPTEDEL